MSSSELFVIILGSGSFTIGIVVGMFLYRFLWYVDTQELRREIASIRKYNTTLQDEIYELRLRLDELRSRVKLVAGINADLDREHRTDVTRRLDAMDTQ